MIIRFLAFLALVIAYGGPASADDMESPMLAERVAKGELPPLAQRIPESPVTIDLAARGKTPGRYGGTVRILISGQRDIRYMTIFGYSRLVGFNEKLELVADILQGYEVSEGRIFTFHLRPGLRWSDGEPLTPEDFRYAFEDVLSNEDLSPSWSAYLLVDGKPPSFAIVDDLTVRYSWDKPNPDFLPQLAAAQPLPNILLPAHYLKQFHKKYQEEDKLEELMKANKAKKWTALHIAKSRQYRPENPDLPTLDPWRNLTKPPAEQFVFERNPYYYKIDGRGWQLPYIDRFVLNVSSSSLIPAKTGAGESDLQATNIQFDDYTFLKEAEHNHPIKVKLWKRTQGSRVALFPNFNYWEPEWRKVFDDVRFRRALSLAIDRREINLAVFFGLGEESADTILPASPLFRDEYKTAWAKHDVAEANRLLDEMGLDKRDSDGVRLLPDGRRAEIIIESSGEAQVETDVLELVVDHWAEIGIRLLVRTTQIDIFRNRVIGGQTMMSIWSGMDNGIPTPDMNPHALAPTNHEQLQWAQWGMNYETSGEKGTAPDLKEAADLLAFYKAWRSAETTDMRADAWHKMLALYSDQVFSIGIVNSTLQPIVASSRLRNLPESALFSFDPTAFFGVYGIETFWLDEGGT
ncbi:ABC transporter substrate-binding protein [soil metagenome]